ncbi:MAG: class I SAM-dependent methyltransferase [candidate division WOR-3 bacterium]|jgi:ubiquinone/menaquinone biosynthesis C-methylase UbiE
MSKDKYRDFADRYDLFHGEFGEHKPVYRTFFQKLFVENKVHSVLDCACGTGHDLYLVYSLGCEVIGSDISESMLAHARKNLKSLDIKIPLQKIDYRLVHKQFKHKFDAVVCLSSSILHMPDKKEVIKAFLSMRRILRDNGLLVLTQGTTDKQWKQKPRFLMACSKKDFMRMFVIDYLERGARYNIVDIWHGKPKPEMKVWHVDYEQILLKDDYSKLLQLAGFRKVRFYGSYKYEPYSKKESDMLIVVAHK